MIEITGSTRVRVNPSRLRFIRVGGKIIMYDIATDRVFRINQTTLEIITMLDGNHTFNNVAQRVAQKYSVSKRNVSSDLMHLINQLKSYQLLEGT